jgi:c-di-GMP-binding flagellar brake protein YcgR
MDRQQNELEITDRRRHSRINTSNVVGYVLFDENKNKIEYGKGLTLNLSQSGTLLKTKNPLHGCFIVLMTIDLNNLKIKVKGRVVKTRKSEDDRFYLTGVEFIGSRDENLKAIVAFVKAFNSRKHAKSQQPE